MSDYKWKGGGAGTGGVYFLIFIGATVYYLQHAHTFWEGVVGIFQALFWPAYLIYKVYTLLHM